MEICSYIQVPKYFIVEKDKVRVQHLQDPSILSKFKMEVDIMFKAGDLPKLDTTFKVPDQDQYLSYDPKDKRLKMSPLGDRKLQDVHEFHFYLVPEIDGKHFALVPMQEPSYLVSTSKDGSLVAVESASSQTCRTRFALEYLNPETMENCNKDCIVAISFHSIPDQKSKYFIIDGDRVKAKPLEGSKKELVAKFDITHEFIGNLTQPATTFKVRNVDQYLSYDPKDNQLKALPLGNKRLQDVQDFHFYVETHTDAPYSTIMPLLNTSLLICISKDDEQVTAEPESSQTCRTRFTFMDLKTEESYKEDEYHDKDQAQYVHTAPEPSS